MLLLFLEFIHLREACKQRRESLENSKLLLDDYKININETMEMYQCNEEGRNAVHMSVLNNRLPHLRALVKKTYSSSNSSSSSSSSRSSCSSNASNSCSSNGHVDLNKYDNYNMTPAMYAVKCDTLFGYVLNSGKFDLYAQGGYRNQSLLHMAINLGKLKNVEMLIRSNPRLADLKDANGHTVLHLVSSSWELQSILFSPILAISGSVLNAVTKDNGDSALLLLVKANYSSTASVELLLKNPRTNVNVKDFDGNTALHIACRLARKDIITLLVKDTRTDLNIVNALGLTPLLAFILHAKVSVDSIIVLSYLLKQKRLDPNIPDGKGNRPLFHVLFDQRKVPFLMVLLLSKRLSYLSFGTNATLDLMRRRAKFMPDLCARLLLNKLQNPPSTYSNLPIILLFNCV